MTIRDSVNFNQNNIYIIAKKIIKKTIRQCRLSSCAAGKYFMFSVQRSSRQHIHTAVLVAGSCVQQLHTRSNAHAGERLSGTSQLMAIIIQTFFTALIIIPSPTFYDLFLSTYVLRETFARARTHTHTDMKRKFSRLGI